MKTLSKESARSLIIDPIKTVGKKSSETYATLMGRGYEDVSKIADLQIPSSYVFSKEEGQLFYCDALKCTEIISATIKQLNKIIF